MKRDFAFLNPLISLRLMRTLPGCAVRLVLMLIHAVGRDPQWRVYIRHVEDAAEAACLSRAGFWRAVSALERAGVLRQWSDKGRGVWMQLTPPKGTKRAKSARKPPLSAARSVSPVRLKSLSPETESGGTPYMSFQDLTSRRSSKARKAESSESPTVDAAAVEFLKNERIQPAVARRLAGEHSVEVIREILHAWKRRRNRTPALLVHMLTQDGAATAERLAESRREADRVRVHEAAKVEREAVESAKRRHESEAAARRLEKFLALPIETQREWHRRAAEEVSEGPIARRLSDWKGGKPAVLALGIFGRESQ